MSKGCFILLGAPQLISPSFSQLDVVLLEHLPRVTRVRGVPEVRLSVPGPSHIEKTVTFTNDAPQGVCM